MTTHTSASALSMWDPQIVRRAIGDSFRKLHPRTMVRNPVMFVVEVGSVLTTWRLIQDAMTARPGLGFELQITFWLWLTVLFANFAEAMAEGRGKAQGDVYSKGEPLKKVKTENLVDELFAEIDKYYAAGKKLTVDESAAAEAAAWLAEEEDETAMTPERLAMLEKETAAADADAIDEALSPVDGRRFTRA